MFSSNKADKATRKTTAARPAAPSIISADLKIVGNLENAGEVQVDGTIDGDIQCGKLTIGESARVAGEITADAVVVRGRVDGRIRAKSVQLASSARVVGDIWHDSLSIEAGAFLEGHCQRNVTESEATRTMSVIDARSVTPKPELSTAPEQEPGKRAAARS